MKQVSDEEIFSSVMSGMSETDQYGKPWSKLFRRPEIYHAILLAYRKGRLLGYREACAALGVNFPGKADS